MQIFVVGMQVSRSEALDYSDDGSSVSGDVNEEELDLPWELLVSRICRLWRETAIQTVSLWTTLEFGHRFSMAKIQAYLQRSKNAPLDVVISLMDGDDASYEICEGQSPAFWITQIRQILAVIVPYVHRWRALKINVVNYRPMAKALVELGKCSGAPLLEKLELELACDEKLDCPFPYPSLTTQDFVIFHGSVPRLKTLYLSGVFLDWPRYHGLNGLTSLDLRSHYCDVRPSLADLTRILHESPNLKLLTLAETLPAGQSREWGASPIKLPSLEYFAFGHVRPTKGAALLTRLAMPNLTHLVLNFEERGNCDALFSALSKSHPGTRYPIFSKIEILNLHGIKCGKRVLQEACAALDNLREFELSGGMLKSGWFDFFISKKSAEGTVYFPKLEKLRLIGGVTAEGTYRLVKQRMRWTRSLKNVYAKTSCANLEQPHEAWLLANLQSMEFEDVNPLNKWGVSEYWTDGDNDSSAEEKKDDNGGGNDRDNSNGGEDANNDGSENESYDDDESDSSDDGDEGSSDEYWL